MQPLFVPSPLTITFLRRIALPLHQQTPLTRKLFHTTPLHHQPQSPNSPPVKSSPPIVDPSQKTSPLRPARPHIRAYDGELQPRPLTRVLGVPNPPQAGENTGIAPRRSLSQRRADFVSYDKHLDRRKYLITELYQKNYFRDIGNLGKIHKGKSIIAPATPFKASVALWFPNLRGETLARGGAGRNVDTTPVLRGKVTVLGLVNTEWAREQCQTFVGTKEGENPALQQYLESEGVKGVAQMVWLNVEPNWAKAALVRLFMWRERQNIPEGEWGRHFLITKGMSDELKEALAVWNAKVGYVYLLDQNCKVRWAGNGPAREEERKSLLNCLKRLVDEAKGIKRVPAQRLHSMPLKGDVEKQPSKIATDA